MNNDKKQSSSNTDGLFIPNRQLSALIASALAVLFCVFMGGYFVGKNHMIEPLLVRMEDGSFADQVYTSLLARYPDGANAHKEEMVADENGVVVVEEVEKTQEMITNNNIQPNEMKYDGRRWYAPLIGYPNEQSAVAFAGKLQKKGVDVLVKKCPSSTAQGKKKYWYQVVTAPCENRTLLQTIVDKVAREEKLKNVDIKEIKS